MNKKGNVTDMYETTVEILALLFIYIILKSLHIQKSYNNNVFHWFLKSES